MNWKFTWRTRNKLVKPDALKVKQKCWIAHEGSTSSLLHEYYVLSLTIFYCVACCHLNTLEHQEHNLPLLKSAQFLNENIIYKHQFVVRAYICILRLSDVVRSPNMWHTCCLPTPRAVLEEHLSEDLRTRIEGSEGQYSLSALASKLTLMRHLLYA